MGNITLAGYAANWLLYVLLRHTPHLYARFLSLVRVYGLRTLTCLLIMLSELRGGIQKELKDCLHLVIVNDLSVYNLIHCVSDGLRVT